MAINLGATKIECTFKLQTSLVLGFAKGYYGCHGENLRTGEDGG